MIVNFKTCEINRGTHKLIRTTTLIIIIIKKNYVLACFVFSLWWIWDWAVEAKPSQAKRRYASASVCLETSMCEKTNTC